MRLFGVLGAVSGFVAVAAGPLGIHHAHLSGEMLEVFETGVRYQMIHAAALLAVAVAGERAGGPVFAVAGWLFVAGQLFFPFPLYALALTANHAWGMVTPVGGVCYMAGWIALVVAFARRPEA